MTHDPMPFLRKYIDGDIEFLTKFFDLLDSLPVEDRDVAGPRATWVRFDRRGRVVEQRWEPKASMAVKRAWLQFDPTRWWLEAHARQWIAEEHREREGRCAVCVDSTNGRPVAVTYPCRTLRYLTWSYWDYADFDPGWRAPDPGGS